MVTHRPTLFSAPSCSAHRKKFAIVHDVLPLAPETSFKGNEIRISTPCQLAVLSFSKNNFLLKDTEDANIRLEAIMAGLRDNLHESGTVAIFVPRPWDTHLGRIRGIIL